MIRRNTVLVTTTTTRRVFFVVVAKQLIPDVKFTDKSTFKNILLNVFCFLSEPSRSYKNYGMERCEFFDQFFGKTVDLTTKLVV